MVRLLLKACNQDNTFFHIREHKPLNGVSFNIAVAASSTLHTFIIYPVVVCVKMPSAQATAKSIHVTDVITWMTMLTVFISILLKRKKHPIQNVKKSSLPNSFSSLLFSAYPLKISCVHAHIIIIGGKRECALCIIVVVLQLFQVVLLFLFFVQ